MKTFLIRFSEITDGHAIVQADSREEAETKFYQQEQRFEPDAGIISECVELPEDEVYVV